ncbi:MAG: SEC-C metal-binding domain-containing protein [Kofleriaceae bacterium]
MPITQDPARLAAIAGALGEAARGAERGERVRLPVVKGPDAAGITLAMAAEFDDAIAERSDKIEQGGHVMACNKGCNACCVSALVVSEPEAATVAEWLAQPDNAAVRAQFVAKLPQWKRTAYPEANAVVAASTDEERRAAAIAYTRKGAMCAFNHEGACSIYPARPARCRMAHALVDNSHCGQHGDGQIQYYEHARTQITFEEQEQIRAVMHMAMRPNAEYEMLCTAVDRLLGTSAAIGRNDPCPCGSGKKYKRCCG